MSGNGYLRFETGPLSRKTDDELLLVVAEPDLLERRVRLTPSTYSTANPSRNSMDDGSHAAKSRAAMRSEAAMVRREKSVRRRQHFGDVEEMRHQGAPLVSRAQRRSLNAVSSKSVSARSMQIVAPGRVVENRSRSASSARPSSVSRTAAPPPDERRQARQPQRRDGVVEVLRLQPVAAPPCSPRRARAAPDFALGDQDATHRTGVAERLQGLSRGANRSDGPTATTVATSARIGVAPLA